MSVKPESAAGSYEYNGTTYTFCSDHCLEKFKTDPAAFAPAATEAPAGAMDPVCGMSVDPSAGKPSCEYKGTTYHFCCSGCMDRFKAEPEKYLAPDYMPMGMPMKMKHGGKKAAAEAKDPVCGMTVKPESAAGSFEHDGTTYTFCSEHCLEKFKADPGAFLGGKPADPAKPAPKGARYTCPMDPEVVQDHPGACPKCGMALEPMEVTAPSTRTVYTCPMHPEVKQDEPGACPKCGMALEATTVTVEEKNPELKDMARRFWVALALTVPVFAVALTHMVPALKAMHIFSTRTAGWIEFVLSTPVVLWAGWVLLKRGWNSVVNRSLNMFTLIGMGVGVSYLYSVVALLFPQIFPPTFRDAGGQIATYFDAAAMITVLVLLGQVMELKARSRTSSAIKALLGLAPKTARKVEDDGTERDVPLDEVQPGDTLARPAGREGARRRRRPGRLQLRRRVHDHGRTHTGRKSPGRHRHGRDGQRHGQLHHARRARRQRDAPRADRSNGERGPAEPRAHPAHRGRGRFVVCARRNPLVRDHLHRLGAGRPATGPGLCARQRCRGPDDRLPLRPRARHAHVHHGGYGTRRPGGHPHQERRIPGGPAEGRHPRSGQDGHADRRQAAAHRRGSRRRNRREGPPGPRRKPRARQRAPPRSRHRGGRRGPEGRAVLGREFRISYGQGRQRECARTGGGPWQRPPAGRAIRTVLYVYLDEYVLAPSDAT